MKNDELNLDPKSEEMQRIFRLEKLENDFNDLQKITDKWGFLRQIYMELLPWILERAKVNTVIPINPYPVNWLRYFSPIEEIAWISIRSHYMALYPQFPVFNYFIDFANPHLRIGLELDGKDFHNPEKDKVRDELLWKHGWRIFRIKGSECHVKYKSRDEILEDYSSNHGDEDQRDSEYKHWITNTADGVVYALKIVYFLKDETHPLYDLCYYALEDHRGAHFPLFDKDWI